MTTSTHETNGRSGPGSPTGRFTRNLQNVAGDLADLGQLQAELFAIDGRATVRTLILPALLGIVGGLVVATASLLAFAGLGLWMHAVHGYALHVAFLLAAAGAFAFGLLCLAAGWLFVRWSGIPLSRSWRELKLNLAWTRRALFGPRSSDRRSPSTNPR